MAKDMRGGKRSAAGQVEIGERDLNPKKTGVSFQSLSPYLQSSINANLKMSATMKKDLLSGRKYSVTDEWTTGRGNQKIKVITEVKDGKVSYSVKKRNKYLLRDTSKEQVANKVAQFYIELNK